MSEKRPILERLGAGFGAVLLATGGVLWLAWLLGVAVKVFRWGAGL